MRLPALVALALFSSGCTTQSIGARCEQSSDCDNGVACVSELNPSMTCEGSMCICCPTDHATLANTPACLHSMGGTGTTDAGTTDAGATDAGATDAGATDAGATDAGTTDAATSDAGATDAATGSQDASDGAG